MTILLDSDRSKRIRYQIAEDIFRGFPVSRNFAKVVCIHHVQNGPRTGLGLAVAIQMKRVINVEHCNIPEPSSCKIFDQLGATEMGMGVTGP